MALGVSTHITWILGLYDFFYHLSVLPFKFFVINDEMVYRGVAYQHSPAYSYQCLSDFLFLHTFVQASLRVAIFGIKIDNDVLYCEIAHQPSPAYSSLYLSDFLSFHTLNNEIFRQRFLQNRASWSSHGDNDVLWN